jgi:hypothetical protein
VTRALASKPGTTGALAIYGISLGTLTQYSATPGTQVAGATKHRQGAPRVVPGVTAQVTDSVTHTFEGAAERLDTGEGACVIMKTSAPSAAVLRGKDHHHRPAVLFIAPLPSRSRHRDPSSH